VGRELREQLVFKALLKMCPGLEERLLKSSEEELDFISDLVRELLSVLPLLILIIFADTERHERCSR
jgi:hypothetical protein